MFEIRKQNGKIKPFRDYIIAFGLVLASILGTTAAFGEKHTPNTKGFNIASSVTLTEEEEAWLSQHNQIRIALKHNWKPIEFMSEGQQFQGVFADYLSMLESKLHLNFVKIDTRDAMTPEYVDMLSSVSNIESLNNSEYKALNPLFTFRHAIYTRQKTTGIQNIDSLNGKHVAVYKHGQLVKYLSKNHPKLNLLKVDIAEEAFNALKLNNIDAYIGNEIVIDYEIELQGINFIKKAGYAPSHAVITMAVRQDWPILQSILNKSIIAFSSEKEEIIHNWDISPKDNETFFIYTLPLISLFVGFAFFKSYSLKQTIKQKESESQKLIWDQANFDFLTGLSNRFMFNKKLTEEIKQADQNKTPFALLFIDLDYFKEVNDQFGHAIGDQLLTAVAHRITNATRASDSVSRFGGDEFTLILNNLDNSKIIQSTADKILKSLEKPFNILGKTVHVTSSIGATIYPKDTRDTTTLIKNADQAMYAAKELGRNRLQFFTKSMQEETAHHLEISNGLQKALISNEFKLHYQPIVELTTKKIVKAEALLRWHHPTKGIIKPNDIIKVAEETGVIQALGHWIFKQSLEDVRKIQETASPDFEVSINVSPKQFNSNSELNKWPNLLKKSGVKPNTLTVEITEGVVLKSNKMTNKLIKKLLAANINIAIDDFGTGYSSISYLKDFDIYSLKLDRSFVSGLETNKNNKILCHSIIDMAHKLDIKVIAEGIENQQQMALLLEYGCDYGQGYLFSKAKLVDKLIKDIQKV